MEPEELTGLALEAAVAAGAGYADARWVREETEGLTVTDGRVDDLEAEESSGLGVRVLVLLGATAAQALLGSSFRVSRQRGQFLESGLAPRVLATVHPSSILRAPDEEARALAYKGFVADLSVVAEELGGPASG